MNITSQTNVKIAWRRYADQTGGGVDMHAGAMVVVVVVMRQLVTTPNTANDGLACAGPQPATWQLKRREWGRGGIGSLT